jgi:hypothetical protein
MEKYLFSELRKDLQSIESLVEERDEETKFTPPAVLNHCHDWQLVLFGCESWVSHPVGREHIGDV